MTAVAASPAAVGALSAVFDEGSVLLHRSARILRAALGRFAASQSEFGSADSDVPEILEQEAHRTELLSQQLTTFVDALRSADAAGMGLALGRPLRLSEPDVVLFDSANLSLFEPLQRGTTIRDLVALVEAELDHHDRLRPSGRAGFEAHRRWAGSRADLVSRLRQYRALVDPPHGGGWAGTDVRWTAAEDFLAAVEFASIQLGNRLLEPGARRVEPLRWRRDGELVTAAGSDRPFLAAALGNGALLTPDRVVILDDLDALARMPLDQFLDVRAAAITTRPHYDWTADGCSGPIPPAAQQACVRHDFLYRNARMLRDQWGLAEGFAGHIKEAADDRFGAELFDAYSWWELGLDPLLIGWLGAAEVAVRQFGDVGEPWSPPNHGAFFGSALPGR